MCKTKFTLNVELVSVFRFVRGSSALCTFRFRKILQVNIVLQLK